VITEMPFYEFKAKLQNEGKRGLRIE